MNLDLAFKSDLIKYPEYTDIINKIIEITQKEKRHINYLILYVANYLHPLHHGKEVPKSRILEVKSYLIKLCNNNPDVVVEIIKWEERPVLDISHEFCWGENNLTSKPRVWWKNFHHHFPILFGIYQRISSIPCSSAAVERSFSIQSYIFNKHRTSMNSNTLYYLMNIKYNKPILEEYKEIGSILDKKYSKLQEYIQLNDNFYKISSFLKERNKDF